MNEEAKEVPEVNPPIKTYKCPNCNFIGEASRFRIISDEERHSHKVKICPSCGICFAMNVEYMSRDKLQELHKKDRYKAEKGLKIRDEKFQEI